MGDRLSAVVAQQIDGTRFELRTPAGALLLESRTALAVGRAAVLEILSGGLQPRVRLLALPATSTAAGDTSATTVGSVLRATLLRPVALAGTLAGTPSPAPAGGVGAPGLTGTATPTALQPGDGFAVRILGLAGPPGAGGGVRSLPPGAAVGVVVGSGAAGETVVRASFGEFSLSLRGSPPAGSTVMFRVESAVVSMFDGEDGAASLHPLSSRWESLARALAALAEASPGARQALMQSLPQPGTQLAGTVLFLLSALRAGNIRSWLGEEATRGLERIGALGQLGDDFPALRRLPGDGQEWRSYLIPLLVDGRLDQLRLYIHDRSQLADPDEASATRFVIEVTFARFGPFQFDGLSRRRQFDLIIRTERPVAEAMRADIVRIFTDALEALGLTGRIKFSVENPFAVRPLADVVRDDGRSVVA